MLKHGVENSIWAIKPLIFNILCIFYNYLLLKTNQYFIKFLNIHVFSFWTFLWKWEKKSENWKTEDGGKIPLARKNPWTCGKNPSAMSLRACVCTQALWARTVRARHCGHALCVHGINACPRVCSFLRSTERTRALHAHALSVSNAWHTLSHWSHYDSLFLLPRGRPWCVLYDTHPAVPIFIN